MVTEIDLELIDGRTLHVYDAHAGGSDAHLAVFWHHGTPNTGAPPEPLFAAADRLGIRWVSHDRPGYGGSTPQPGRTVASVAADVASIADALGIDRFAVMGHSGGGSHALACAALLPDRVLAAVSGSALAPRRAEGLDWFAGMSDAERMHAAVMGREALENYNASSEWDPEQFTPADHAALSGRWGWLLSVVRAAMDGGTEGMVDDDLAYVTPWGCEPERATSPVLFLHGGEDRVVPISHARWLADRCPLADLWVRPEEGHVSVLTSAEEAMEWLVDKAGPR